MSEKPRIVVVSPTAGLFGGTERVLEILISQLGQDSNVAILFLEDGPLVKAADQNGIPHRIVARDKFRNPANLLRVLFSIRKYVRQYRADVVFAWTDFAQLYAGPASWGIAKSVWWQQSNVDRSIITRLCKLVPSAGAIANSVFTRDQLRANGVLVAERPFYPCIETKRFLTSINREESREALRLPKDRFIVGSVGRMQAWKGFHTIVNAIAELRVDHPSILGVLVGGPHALEPEYEGILRRHIKELGLSEHFILPGSQRDVHKWMSAMDVFVHGAEREPFGLVVPEAMALGLPVIASVPGGPAEAIDDGKTGILVSTGSVPQLVDAIQRLMQDPIWAELMGRAARQESKQFGSEAFAQRLAKYVFESANR